MKLKQLINILLLMVNGSFESKTLEEIKVEAFDMDMMVDVIEI